VHWIRYYTIVIAKLIQEWGFETTRLRKGAMIKGRASQVLVVVVVFAVVVSALLVWLSQMSSNEGQGALGEEEAQELLADIPQDGTTLGSEDAPVTVYLYEDLQCPACAHFYGTTFPDLVTRYVEPGNAKLVAETLTVIGPDSTPAAEAAISAGEQDRYWEYSTLFFLNQRQENSGYVTDEFLTGIAEKTQGLDVSQWNETRQTDTVDSELEAAKSSAQDEGIEATPTLVITGPGGTKTLVGAVPIDQVASAIDEVEAS
jgi:protein-disulfide isomerase